VALSLAFAAPASAAQEPDPGILLEVDTVVYELRSRDLREGTTGPVVRVAIGSPGSPTPAGRFPLYLVVLNPAWRPDWETPRMGPSLHTPMGVAKIPFSANGTVALHGAGDALLLGKPVSAGCVRVADADLLRVIACLHQRGALAPPTHQPDGEVHRPFRRPTLLVVSGTSAAESSQESP
jgi:hypothetical protein